MKEKDYERFMKLAVEEAKNSLKEGNEGFGAVLVKNDRIITKAHGTEVTDSDPTAHAETNVIRKASKNRGGDLKGCVLISTHEPCPMCAGAIVWAKISEIVYGVSIKDSVKLGRTMMDLSCREIIERSPWKVRIKEGVLKKECLTLHNNEIHRLIKEFRAAKETGWKGLERKLLRKRIRWFEENKNEILKELRGTDVEKAYQLILMRIGVEPSEAPIIEKSENKIVFHSRNFRPALKACKILGLDPRKVCKLVFEKPTEELIRRINPRLRFTRNYRRIRPYTPCCEEIIVLEKRSP